MKDENVHPALRPKETVVVQLRAVPAELHRTLKIEAMDEGTSLEQHIVRLLAIHALKGSVEKLAKAVKT